MKLIILLITVSLSANAGWFGNSIEGAFDMKLGEDLSETHIFELQKSYHLAPKYPLNLFIILDNFSLFILLITFNYHILPCFLTF